jgi:hypothetical protein
LLLHSEASHFRIADVCSPGIRGCLPFPATKAKGATGAGAPNDRAANFTTTVNIPAAATALCRYTSPANFSPEITV